MPFTLECVELTPSINHMEGRTETEVSLSTLFSFIHKISVISGIRNHHENILTDLLAT